MINKLVLHIIMFSCHLIAGWLANKGIYGPAITMGLVQLYVIGSKL